MHDLDSNKAPNVHWNGIKLDSYIYIQVADYEIIRLSFFFLSETINNLLPRRRKKKNLSGMCLSGGGVVVVVVYYSCFQTIIDCKWSDTSMEMRHVGKNR
jgi:hypothetical protein